MIEAGTMLQTASQTAAGVAIAGLWQGLLLAAMAWIAIRVAPRTSAGVRFLLWASVFVATVMLPGLSLFAGHQGLTGPRQYGAASNSLLTLDSRWAIGISLGWMAVATIRAAALARHALRLRSLWKSATPVACGPLERLLRRSRGFRGAELCSSLEVDQPCVIGFAAPRILIPSWLLARATDAEMEQIVRHETAHLRRFDDWTNLFQKLALIVVPLNLGLLWMERRLCAEREAACDERVLQATNAPRAYAICLANLAEHRLEERLGRPLSLSLGAWERRSALAGRIHNILSRQAKFSPLRAGAMLTIFVLGTVAGALELSKSSQLISFTTPQPVLAASQASQSAIAQAAYREVAYRGPLPGRKDLRAAGSQLLANPASGGHLSTHRHRNTIAGPPRLLRAAGEQPSGRTLVLVTQWIDPSGQRPTVTVIRSLIHFPANPLRPVSTGWYVFQL